MDKSIENHFDRNHANANNVSAGVDLHATASLSPPAFQLKAQHSQPEKSENKEAPEVKVPYQLAADGNNPPSPPDTPNGNDGNGTIQQQPNDTGLPDNLKSGVENLSGFSLNDVKVHYNSPKPAQLQAHAYAHGTDIHVASGQEKHLPHEAWHVVQQKQGRVKPTKQLKAFNINDDSSLEKEADVMGDRAMRNTEPKLARQKESFHNSSKNNIQRKVRWNDVEGAYYDDYPFKVHDPHDRDQMETKMVIDALQTIGPQLSEEDFHDLKTRIPTEERLTKKALYLYFADKLGPVPELENMPDSGTTDRMVQEGESRLGFYEWTNDQGESDFFNWLNDVENKGAEMKMNCWQALFVLAIDAGVMTKETVKARIALGSSEASLFVENANVLDHLNFNNAISKGDVIVINTNAEDLWHVIMSGGENNSDYRNIPVISHYRGAEKDRDNSMLTKTTLGRILESAPDIKSITYKSLI